jgi:uncharacterized protein YicC (UPF0701 family)
MENPARIDPFDVLRWPGVLSVPEIDYGPVREAALDLFERGLAELGTTRAREGARLADMILERCAGIEVLVTTAANRLPEVLAHHRQRLTDKLAELRAELDLDRLKAHLAEVRDVLQRDEAVGRRLDFLMQELNREANTLGSKSADVATTRVSVDLKVLIEQMREQVQNIE